MIPYEYYATANKMLTTGYLEIYEDALKQGEMTEIISNTTMDLSKKISKHIVED